jgi:hypothetical protein
LAASSAICLKAAESHNENSLVTNRGSTVWAVTAGAAATTDGGTAVGPVEQPASVTARAARTIPVLNFIRASGEEKKKLIYLITL